MKCKECGSGGNRVISSEKAREGVRRRRECLRCGYRWNTMEVVYVEPVAQPKPKAKAERKARVDYRERAELEDLAGGWDSELDDILNELGAS